MALISQSEVEARLGRSLTTEESNSFSTINNSIQTYVERLIGSKVESVSATTRYYDGGVQHLKIDPCTAVSAVKYINEDLSTEYTFLTSDYTIEPINYTVKTMVRNRDGKFARGMNNIAITAKFSIYDDANILSIVKDAILSAICNEVGNSTNVKRESIEGYSIEYANNETVDALKKLTYLFPEV